MSDNEEDKVMVSDQEDNVESDDSDMDDDEGDEIDTAKLSEIDERIRQNPFDYQAHVDKIALLKAAGELDDLRKAREHFAEIYPLTPAIWLDWINDEKNVATSDDEKMKVIELFQRAVKDYVDVGLWLEFCQFFIGTTDGLTKAKDIFEQAIASVGLHVAKGALVWEVYREFENAMLSMQPQNVEQFDKVDKIFRRQLAVPLLDMQNTFEEYSAWLATFDTSKRVDPNVERQFKSAVAMLTKREELENELASCEGDEAKSLEIYDRYLGVELKDGHPTRIQCLFERRITEHCLQPKVWIEYVDYLDRQLKMASVSLPVYERAVRNCTWSSELWIKFMRSKERFGSEKEDILKLSEQALSSGFSDPADYTKIWLAYIDFLRRRMTPKEEGKDQFEKDREEIRALFGRALEHVAPLGGDPECILARYWASLEADRFRNTEEARKIWADVLAVVGDKTKYHLEVIQMEKSFGDSKHIRRAFSRALERVKDFPDTIGEAWLQFEREEGDLQQFEEAEAKIKTRMSKFELERAKVLAAELEEQKRRDEKVEKKKVKDLEKRREKRRQDSEQRRNVENVDRKRKFEGKSEPEEPKFKKPAPEEMPPPPPPGFKAPIAPPPGFKAPVAPPPGFKGDTAPPPGFKAETHGHGEDAEKQIRTVFLSNLDFSVDESSISDAMSKSGHVVEVRLVKNPAGKSKGFAYVEFSSESEARSALARDREMFQGRPLFISECDPEKKQKGHQFRYGTGLEKNKLFVKELSRDTTRDQLEQIFGEFGALKEVRLITYRNGHSKGLAFVEFENEASATKALVKTDGMEIDGKAISVAISNPPAKKPDHPEPEVRSLGGGSRDGGTRGRGRSQVSFVPRALAVKTSSSNGSGGHTGNEKHPEPGTSGGAKSNADFRNMILGKK